MTYGEFISGRSGFEVEGVVVVDAQTGEVKRYDKGKAPKFVDGVLNHETASTLNTYFGKYIHGFWNTKFSQTDMKIRLSGERKKELHRFSVRMEHYITLLISLLRKKE